MSVVGDKPLPRVGVVGCGYWGKNLVRNFHQLGALACVHDIDKNVADEVAAAHGVPSLSFDEILNNDDVLGVVIATPAIHHAQAVEAALRAGKNVFVEKPLALSLSEAEELCRLADQSKLILMVGHPAPVSPSFREAKGNM